LGKRIKVIHIADKFGVGGSSIHGVTRLFSWWMPRFNEDKYDVSLIGLREPDRAYENLRSQGIRLSSLNRGRFDFGTVNAIARIVRREKVDILHLHGYGASNFGQMAARLTGVKTIIHEHFVDPNIPVYQTPFDFVLSRFVDHAFAVSESVRDFMVKKRFMARDKVEVLYNGAPLNEFKPFSDSEIQAERKRWNIPDGARIIGTVGRLDTQKGLRYLIEAAARLLSQKDRKVKFIIAGDGPLMESLRQLSRDMGVEDAVIFPGHYANIPLLQSMIDIQAFPSLWEGTPLTVFEAMSMELPIISTDVDGLGEVLKNGQNALVVASKNPAALASGMEKLLDDPELAQRLSRQALVDSKRFDIQNSVTRMEAVYDLLAS